MSEINIEANIRGKCAQHMTETAIELKKTDSKKIEAMNEEESIEVNVILQVLKNSISKEHIRKLPPNEDMIAGEGDLLYGGYSYPVAVCADKSNNLHKESDYYVGSLGCEFKIIVKFKQQGM